MLCDDKNKYKTKKMKNIGFNTISFHRKKDSKLVLHIYTMHMDMENLPIMLHMSTKRGTRYTMLLRPHHHLTCHKQGSIVYIQLVSEKSIGRPHKNFEHYIFFI